MKARTFVLLALAAPALAGLCAAGTRLVSPPAFAALYSSVLGPTPPPPAAAPVPAAVSQPQPAPVAHLSVDAFLRDDLTMLGQDVVVTGKPSCLSGAGCVLYDDGLKNAVSLNKLPQGHDKARLLTCDPSADPCVVVIHALVVPDYDGSPALAVQSIAWRH